METTKQMPSSIFPEQEYERVEVNQLAIPTYILIIILVCIFILLKKFIYTPDGDRAGK